MPPKSKDSRIRLGEPLATELAAYRAAIGQGATEIGVIRDAVREFITNRTRKDRALRERYEKERRRITGEKVRPLRLVSDADNEP
jgi:hypothetical protein